MRRIYLSGLRRSLFIFLLSVGLWGCEGLFFNLDRIDYAGDGSDLNDDQVQPGEGGGGGEDISRIDDEDTGGETPPGGEDDRPTDPDPGRGDECGDPEGCEGWDECGYGGCYDVGDDECDPRCEGDLGCVDGECVDVHYNDCGGQCEDGYECIEGECYFVESGGECDETNQCGADQWCIEGRCVNDCESDDDCGEGWWCNGGECDDAELDRKCSTNSDCVQGVCNVEYGYCE